MVNGIEKMDRLLNGLMVPKLSVGMEIFIGKMVQLSNGLMVPKIGIGTINESIVNPTKSF
jgi:hypothetical protein